jgi:hypothetical protein
MKTPTKDMMQRIVKEFQALQNRAGERGSISFRPTGAKVVKMPTEFDRAPSAESIEQAREVFGMEPASEGSWQEAKKLLGPMQSPEIIARELEAEKPAVYKQWREAMVRSAKETLRSRADQISSGLTGWKTDPEFYQHMLRNYEKSVVDQAYREMGMAPGKRLGAVPSPKGKLTPP